MRKLVVSLLSGLFLATLPTSAYAYTQYWGPYSGFAPLQTGEPPVTMRITPPPTDNSIPIRNLSDLVLPETFTQSEDGRWNWKYSDYTLEGDFPQVSRYWVETYPGFSGVESPCYVPVFFDGDQKVRIIIRMKSTAWCGPEGKARVDVAVEKETPMSAVMRLYGIWGNPKKDGYVEIYLWPTTSNK